MATDPVWTTASHEIGSDSTRNMLAMAALPDLCLASATVEAPVLATRTACITAIGIRISSIASYFGPRRICTTGPPRRTVPRSSRNPIAIPPSTAAVPNQLKLLSSSRRADSFGRNSDCAALPRTSVGVSVSVIAMEKTASWLIPSSRPTISLSPLNTPNSSAPFRSSGQPKMVARRISAKSKAKP